VPCIIDWPGVIKPGSVSDTPVHGVDFYATLLAMTGLPQQPEHHEDSVNLVPLLEGDTDFERGLYRLTLRAILSRQCERQGFHLGTTPSIRELLRALRETETLPDDLYADLDQLREATFAAEWGTGRRPERSQVQWVLDHAPNLLRALQRLWSD